MGDIFTRLLAVPWPPNWYQLMPAHLCPNFEDKYVYTYSQQPLLWKRIIENIVLIWTYSIEELDDFIN